MNFLSKHCYFSFASAYEVKLGLSIFSVNGFKVVGTSLRILSKTVLRSILFGLIIVDLHLQLDWSPPLAKVSYRT